MGAFLADLFDLLFPGLCVVCGAAGRELCRRCGAEIAGRPFPAPSPGAGSGAAAVPCWAGGGYDGALRSVILAYKERRQHRLAAPLGVLLAVTVEAALLAGGSAGPVDLVPVPSAPEVARARGGDHVRRLAVQAARRLRRRGVPARVAPLLAVRVRTRDSVGLSAAERRANVAGAFEARAALTVRRGPGLVVLVDDLVTTGATLGEAARAMAAGGRPAHLAAVLAATPRRTQPHPPLTPAEHHDHLARRDPLTATRGHPGRYEPG